MNSGTCIFQIPVTYSSRGGILGTNGKQGPISLHSVSMLHSLCAKANSQESWVKMRSAKMKCRLLSFTLSCVRPCHCLSWSPPTRSEKLCHHRASSELVRVQTIGYVTGRTAAVSKEEQRRTLFLASSISCKNKEF